VRHGIVIVIISQLMGGLLILKVKIIHAVAENFFIAD